MSQRCMGRGRNMGRVYPSHNLSPPERENPVGGMHSFSPVPNDQEWESITLKNLNAVKIFFVTTRDAMMGVTGVNVFPIGKIPSRLRFYRCR
ncbi:hypothetical protein TNIN_387511 [Trichonephila inaurata madagascariensis]|uniref:Uncharacterized protein n=1 Tax=Trichonephila inaurata madagascariensis TaxID=2747483 RepID=A0A8X6X3K7_9ARAC|nr:hypothetical protein TNIN_387511 [Trichonephila inaurata madagascariensis]